MKITKPFATILVVLASIAVIFSIRFLNSSKTSFDKVIAARTKGNPNARVQIIEYLDYQCPACAKGATVLREYMKRFPYDIYLQVKYYPISAIHEHALKSATYAECAARQDKFWPFQDWLVNKQAQWSKVMNPDDLFREIAKQANVDMQKLDACLNDEKVQQTILKEKSQGKAAGVNSTPTYFINEKMIVGPKPLIEELDRYFEKTNLQ